MSRSRSGARFATTHWSLVHAAGRPSSAQARAALASLCEAYWYPLYAFIRRRGHSADDARDLTQAFFATLLDKGYLRAADKSRGRFRSFMLAACQHFLSKERDRTAARKRGGGRIPMSLDFDAGENRYLQEAAHELTAERIYERRWAITLLDRVMVRLHEDYARAGKSELFERLKDSLAGESCETYGQTAAALGMTPGAVKVAAHRVRKRFRALLCDEIAQTLSAPEDLDDEIRLLFAAVRLS
jgi:RNA polymerase sigma-70 factor (ECF subfamily)